MAGKSDAEFFLREAQRKNLRGIRPVTKNQGGDGPTKMEVNDFMDQNFHDVSPINLSDRDEIRKVQSRQAQNVSAREGILKELQSRGPISSGSGAQANRYLREVQRQNLRKVRPSNRTGNGMTRMETERYLNDKLPNRREFDTENISPQDRARFLGRGVLKKQNDQQNIENALRGRVGTRSPKHTIKRPKEVNDG